MSKSLKGKVIVNFGDSIFGNFRVPEDISSYLADMTGATVYNVGFGGCRMGEHVLPQFDRFGMYRLADAVTSGDFSLQDESFSYEPIGEALPAYFKGSLELLKSIDFSKVDIITIAYGTNDFTGEVPLVGKDKYDTKSFDGAMRYSLEKLMSAFPHIKIAVCSQLYRFWWNEDGTIKGDSDTIDSDGRFLKIFLEKTKEIADEYNLPYIDNYNNCGINAATRPYCFGGRDGSHPVEYGRRLVAANLARELTDLFGYDDERTSKKSIKGKTIVNFGDSVFGNFRAPTDISSHLAALTDTTVYNVGFGGCRMAEHVLPQFDRFCMYRIAYAVTSGDFSLQDEAFSYEPIGEALPAYFKGSLEVLKSIDFSKVDIITISYGTNDFTGGQPFEGTDKYDVKAFCGAMRYSIEALQKAFPHIKIAVCSQIYRFWRGDDMLPTGDCTDTPWHDNYLSAYIEKTKEVAEEYGLLYIDNYTYSGINEKTRDMCFGGSDGTHPIEYGRRLVAQNLAYELCEKFGE